MPTNEQKHQSHCRATLGYICCCIKNKVMNQKSKCRIWLKDGYSILNCVYDSETGLCVKCRHELGKGVPAVSQVWVCIDEKSCGNCKKPHNGKTLCDYPQSAVSSVPQVTDITERITKIYDEILKKGTSADSPLSFITQTAIPLAQQAARKEVVEECLKELEKCTETRQIWQAKQLLQKLIK